MHKNISITSFLQSSVRVDRIELLNARLSMNVVVSNESEITWKSEDVERLPRLGWQVYAFTASLTSSPCGEGRVGPPLALPAHASIRLVTECDFTGFFPGDYLIRIGLLVEDECWFHEKGNKASCYSFHISYPKVVEVGQGPDKTYEIPIRLTDGGYHIFSVTNPANADHILPLLLRLDDDVMFDWDIAPGTTYLWAREAAQGQALLRATLPGGLIEKNEYLATALGLRHHFQPDLASCLTPTDVNTSFMIFYYPWFRTPLFDAGRDLTHGDWERHRWRLDDRHFGARRDIFPRPGFSIQSSHWPLWGLHSSGSDYILRQDLQFIAATGIGTIISSWWPQGTVEDDNLSRLLDIAADLGLKVCCLAEAFHNIRGQSADGYQEVSALLSYLHRTHFQHEAYLRLPDGPVLFEWGSACASIKPRWKETNRAFRDFKASHPNGLTLVALYDSRGQRSLVSDVADYFYTYEMYGIDEQRYPRDMRKHRIWPGVGPGYDERCLPTAWRPEQRMTDRKMGKIFDRQFSRFVRNDIGAFVLVSYNELAEGTCIMPTLPRRDMINNTEGHFSASLGLPSQFAYLMRTRYWIDRLKKNYAKQCFKKIEKENCEQDIINIHFKMGKCLDV